MSTIEEDGHDAVHQYFGLSYSNYLVLHRSLLQSMPAEWQKRFVACMEQVREHFSALEMPDSYIVEAARVKEYAELTAAERELIGVSVDEGGEDDDEAEPLYYDKQGNQVEGWMRALIPTKETIPHYNRGRTFIPKTQ